ncbi:hypothetical protein E4191_00730 [Paracoccus liaowanqingii]|uniref:Uncharacterized protein n=1 Tax=Paracoccus liaowanqingii TaxID=2560053 RepID=A0A4V1BIJ2_9RHOB|nr:DEAD/DEAH box helicase family protein [Paracoccus liaowanqingii]QBX33404.1 hypothetical protein E4191_00730 [Paracoccus liaowanqingii]
METIQVLDSIMGSGKTTKIIDWMIANPDQKYLYVSPLLSEVEERVPTACADAIGFTFPTAENGTSKSQSFLNLLKSAENIATTHSLFKLMTKEHLQLIKDKGYVLIVDEEVNMIEDYSTVCGYLDDLKGWDVVDIDYQNNGKVIVLKEPTNNSRSFKTLFDYAKADSLFASKNSNNALVTQLPVSLLLAAKRVIILTYKFEGSILSQFLKMNNLTYSDFNEFDMPDEKVLKDQIRKLVTIGSTLSTRSLNQRQGYMSATWYETGATAAELNSLRGALRSIYRLHPKQSILITCPLSAVEERHKRSIHDGRDVNPKLDGPKPKRGWLACNTRATNDFSNKTVMIHAYNRYPNRNVESYLNSWGRPIDRDTFALSEMIQWLWRGCIRDGKEMTVYILSKRMLDLFNEWLNEEDSRLLD